MIKAQRKITVVIPTMGNPELLERSIKSLMENVSENDVFDMIIVKNNRRGFAIPSNGGIRLADKDSDIILMNDDVKITGLFLPQFEDALKERVGLISRDVLSCSFGQPSDLHRSSFDMVYIPRTTIAKVGLLDEEYNICTEDIDYCYRVEQAGLEQAKVDLNIEHSGGTTVGKFPKYNEWQKLDNERFRRKFFA